MPRLRRLSGDEVVSILLRFGFHIHTQRGSHIKLRRSLPGSAVQNVGVPRHRELAIGTLSAIYRRACLYIPEEELWEFFHTD